MSQTSFGRCSHVEGWLQHAPSCQMSPAVRVVGLRGGTGTPCDPTWLAFTLSLCRLKVPLQAWGSLPSRMGSWGDYQLPQCTWDGHSGLAPLWPGLCSPVRPGVCALVSNPPGATSRVRSLPWLCPAILVVLLALAAGKEALDVLGPVPWLTVPCQGST